MTALLGTGTHLHAPEFSDAELAALNRQFETAPAQAVIEWAVEQFHPFMCLAASMTDAVLIDLAVSVEPSIEVVFIDTRYHFPETLETVERVRRHYGLNLRVLTVPPQPVDLWQADPANCCSAAKVEPARPGPGRQAGLDERPAPGRGPHPGVGAHRGPGPPGAGEGQPHRHLDRPGRDGYIADHDVPGQPAARPGLPVHRVPSVHPAGRGRARTPFGAVGRARQDGVRPASVTLAP